jgi:hypothetical protein
VKSGLAASFQLLETVPHRLFRHAAQP